MLGLCSRIEIAEQVIALIVGAGIRPRAALEPHSTLAGDLACDAVDRECIAIACEDYFGISIPEGVPQGWQTVADVARSVEVGEQAHRTGYSRSQDHGVSNDR